ncbi:MAG: single-stranded DNA-binding protein [Caldilinea sp.]
MNTATLIGHLGNDPRTRTLDNGTSVADFDLAVNRRYTQNGQQVEQTVWINVTCWRGLAQTVGNFLTKGRQVAVVGRLEAPDAYIDRDGKARARNRVTALNVEFLGAGVAANAPELAGALEAAAAIAMPSEEEIAAVQAAF